MKTGLPPQAVLSPQILAASRLVPRTNDNEASLTDIQYECLEIGIERGVSALVCSPTSTGKTNIAWWTIATTLLRGRRCIYLVSHRALAQQKFDEAQAIFLDMILDGDRTSIVCATGETVEDASGRKTNAPLSSSLLIATYEKFLGCLSVSGVAHDLTDVTFVCDELQIVGDKSRGRSVELLLTLMKKVGWKQFVGLSAVLNAADATALSDWLDLRLVRNPTREKTLKLECRSPGKTATNILSPTRTSQILDAAGPSVVPTTRELVLELLRVKENSPIIVFCMTVDQTYKLSKEFLNRTAKYDAIPHAGLDVSDDLLTLLGKGIAFHNSELNIDEKSLVEDRLARQLVDVVFATATLAAGVNFPLSNAVFAAWARYDRSKDIRIPISKAEFQNMAGRVGRMGQSAAEGRVILTASGHTEVRQARELLRLSEVETISDGIDPDDLGSLILQIFASKLCNSRQSCFNLLSSTLSAAREGDRNIAGVEHWREKLDKQVHDLQNTNCLVGNKDSIAATAFGTAVARSGLHHETAIYLLAELLNRSVQLVSLLPSDDHDGDEDDLLFILVHGVLCSPEFDDDFRGRTRNLNYRYKAQNQLLHNGDASRLSHLLFVQPWSYNPGAANAALVLTSWAKGMPRRDVERLIPNLRSGLIQNLAGDVAWVLTGISDIIAATTAASLADESKPEILRGVTPEVTAIRRLARAISRQASRVTLGLPTDVLWMTALDLQGRRRRLSRTQILSLRSAGLFRPVDLMSGERALDTLRREALDTEGDQGLSNQVRDAARRWKLDDRLVCKRHHSKRASRLGSDKIIEDFYECRGHDFEDAFETCMAACNIKVDRLDVPPKQGWPDYLLTIEDFVPLILECKSKLSDGDTIALNASKEVLSASEIAGHSDKHCVTFCNPGVEPSVPASIEAAGRLTVVDVSDMAEAILKLLEGELTHRGFYDWLSLPGIALTEAIPHR